MSWLSLPNPFQSLQSDYPQPSTSPPHHQNPRDAGGGGASDFTLLGETLIRGVANFLAPPPVSSDSAGLHSSPPESPSKTLLGIKNDLVEIQGSFKSGLSLLSSHKAVAGISRLASNLFGEDNYGNCEGVAGVSDGIIQFVKEISVRPELWTEFPMSLDKIELNISAMQREHISTVEGLTPSLVSLRLNICSDMTEGQFWMIYFILLLPRLNNHDFDLLSTPEIVETRNTLLEKLQNKQNAEMDLGNINPVDSSRGDIKSTTTKVHTKSVPVLHGESISNQEAPKQLGNEDDFSFSDLEDNENDLPNVRSGISPSHDIANSSPNGSSEWIQLKGSDTEGSRHRVGQSSSRAKDSEGEESSNEWLTVDDSDLDGSGTI